MAIAKFIGSTNVAGVRKFRWKCPFCKGRFNLSPKNINLFYNCRHCESNLYLKKW